MFCNQRTISGVSEFDISDVERQIEEALSTMGSDRACQIAFFGGSFTGIDRETMTELLKIADKYVKSGRVESVRCSTRPDYITPEILDLLELYSVKTIELGLQSSEDNVLRLTKRGHGFIDEKNAARLITDRGFDLVGQMMIGLPGSTLDDELRTARFIVESGAKAARIYPTVVFRGTELCDMAESGIYTPLDLEDAIRRSSLVLDVFIEAKVQVIRIGLCAQDNIFDKSNFYAGANHPALGELVVGEWYFNKIRDKLEQICINVGDAVRVYVSNGAISKARGQKNKNVDRFVSLFGLSEVFFLESDELSMYEVEVELERNVRCT